MYPSHITYTKYLTYIALNTSWYTQLCIVKIIGKKYEHENEQILHHGKYKLEAIIIVVKSDLITVLLIHLHLKCSYWFMYNLLHVSQNI